MADQATPAEAHVTDANRNIVRFDGRDYPFRTMKAAVRAARQINAAGHARCFIGSPSEHDVYGRPL